MISRRVIWSDACSVLYHCINLLIYVGEVCLVNWIVWFKDWLQQWLCSLWCSQCPELCTFWSHWIMWSNTCSLLYCCIRLCDLMHVWWVNDFVSSRCDGENLQFIRLMALLRVKDRWIYWWTDIVDRFVELTDLFLTLLMGG